MQNMLHSRANMVVVGGKKDLGFVFQAAVGLTVEKPGVVALKLGANSVSARVNGDFTADCLFVLAA